MSIARRAPYAVAALAAWMMSPAAASAQQDWAGLPAELQIRLAEQAAPSDMRAGATVQGFDASGQRVTLREGTNELICMAPDPTAERFEVSCHFKGLEDFFARGRELTAEGVTGNDRIQARWKEFSEGKLDIPYGSVNYILTGSTFQPGTGEVLDPYLRWTIYTPNATAANTGLSTEPSAGGPWLMFPGTPGAHIMITPPRGGGR